VKRPQAAQSAKPLQYLVFSLFFIFGGVTSLNDVVIPKLRALFTLGYGEAMFVQSAFFAAYFLVSVPASMIVRRFGYLTSAAFGLVTMMAGCLLFVPAATAAVFPAFLIALFVLASGVTLVQVVANPLISRLGDPATTSSRLTFAQAFNSFGTTVFPFVGARLILGQINRASPGAAVTDAVQRAAEGGVIARAYIGLAAVLFVLAVVVWLQRRRMKDEVAEETSLRGLVAVLRRPRFALGALCIFLYVGAEVSVGSLLISYLMQPDVLGLDARSAGERVPFYWGGAMIGRFIAAWLLRRTSPGYLLALCALAAVSLLAISAHTGGDVAAYALLSVGLFNSLMFPTIFSLASEGLGSAAADGSGVICAAIVGGAVIPPITGRLADLLSLRLALLAPGLCYAAVLAYGVFAERTRASSGRSVAAEVSARR
jgi:FHS family L-fucose permease-like MFS transporter